jgi:aldehyde dehydrogenase (NAD+)
MRIVQEEIFGPVCVVIKFEDEDDVLRQANDTLYGLAAAVFTKDITRGIQFAHRLHAGMAWVNCMSSVNTNVPFGGNKQSGMGRECGQYALDK